MEADIQPLKALQHKRSDRLENTSMLGHGLSQRTNAQAVYVLSFIFDRIMIFHEFMSYAYMVVST